MTTKLDEIINRLDRIEGKQDETQRLSERVRSLEIWQSWLKGAWAAVVTGYLYLCRQTFGK